MARRREWHTATLLPNGKVLVAGGGESNGVSGTASAELYDPPSRTWSAVPDMALPRYAPTATLLPNGKVLLAGGGGVSSSTATVIAQAQAELYDPSSNTWSPDGTMAVGRLFHTATLLADGRVLVAGGAPGVDGPLVSLTSAETYDPAANAWSPAADMGTPRRRHTATRLPSGEVLVAGGDPATASAERFNPLGPGSSTTGPGSPTTVPVTTTSTAAPVTTTTTTRPPITRPPSFCRAVQRLAQSLGPRAEPLLRRFGCPLPPRS
jgi:hypothetical protein